MGFGISALLERASRGMRINISNRIFEYVILLFSLLLLLWNSSLVFLLSATEAVTIGPDVLLVCHHIFVILMYVLLGFIVGVIVFGARKSNRARQNEQRIEEVKLIAYRLWEEGGCLPGHERENWDKAEAIWDEPRKKKSPR